MFLEDVSKERLIHSFKTALACCLGFMITRSVKFPVDQWILITILVVMCAQINVGSMIQKSYMRFLGTLVGSAIAAFTLYLFGASPTAAALVVIGAGFIFSYVATSKSNINDAGTLGAVTTAIILLSQNASIKSAGERFIEISLGILIAAVVSQFIFPIHARAQIRRNQARTLKKLRDYYFDVMMSKEDLSEHDTKHLLDEKIAQSLIDQRKLAKESVREPLGTAFNRTHFSQLLWCEKEISRSTTFMNHAIHMSKSGRDLLANIPELNEFNNGVCVALEKTAHAIQSKTSKPIPLPNLAKLKIACQDAAKQAHPDDAFYINAYLFCAEIMVERLAELVKLCSEMQQEA